MRTLWTTALILLTLIGAALAQTPEPGRSAIEPPADAAAPSPSAAPPAENAAPPVRAVIEVPPRAAANDDWLASAEGWTAAAWDRLAPARAVAAEVAWMPLLLTLFNGLLALFAYRLWRTSGGLKDAVVAQSQAMTHTLAVLKDAAEATRQIADAALLQARASVGVELPRLELSAVELVHADESIRQALKAPAVSLRFANHGRTTAFLTARCVELRLADALPAEPEYRAVEKLEATEAVASGDATKAGADQRLGELGETEVEALRLGRRTLWAYGFVAFRDFLGIEHRKGFCLRWLPPPAHASIGGSFQPDGSDAYVYERDEPARGTRPTVATPFVLTERAPTLRKPPERMIEPAAPPRPRAVARG
jgi:hypothetical protein